MPFVEESSSYADATAPTTFGIVSCVDGHWGDGHGHFCWSNDLRPARKAERLLPLAPAVQVPPLPSNKLADLARAALYAGEKLDPVAVLNAIQQEKTKE